MAKNLNYSDNDTKSVCYSDLNSNCQKYGRLYDWETARDICPKGWHLPKDEEFNVIKNLPTGALKAKTGWKDSNGTDDYGFAALPGGKRNINGEYVDMDSSGYWWSDLAGDRSYAKALDLNKNNPVPGYASRFRSSMLSVRCVKNEDK